MAYQTGGFKGLTKALKAKTVNTVEWNSGLQVGGVLTEILRDNEGLVSYLKFSGPCQLAFNGKEIPGQGAAQHPEGFGSPVGRLLFSRETLEEIALEDFSFEGLREKLKIREGETVELFFSSQVRIKGIVSGYEEVGGKLKILSFKGCEVRYRDRLLFSPDWGNFDMAIGSQIHSVFSGPPDRQTFGEKGSFEVVKVPKKKYSEEQIKKFSLYEKINSLRESLQKAAQQQETPKPELFTSMINLANEILKLHSEWLLKLEVCESLILAKTALVGRPDAQTLLNKLDSLLTGLLEDLKKQKSKNSQLNELIDNGLHHLSLS
jgi:phenylalanine-4-hydroxylase